MKLSCLLVSDKNMLNVQNDLSICTPKTQTSTLDGSFLAKCVVSCTIMQRRLKHRRLWIRQRHGGLFVREQQLRAAASGCVSSCSLCLFHMEHPKLLRFCSMGSFYNKASGTTAQWIGIGR